MYCDRIRKDGFVVQCVADKCGAIHATSSKGIYNWKHPARILRLCPFVSNFEKVSKFDVVL